MPPIESSAEDVVHDLAEGDHVEIATSLEAYDSPFEVVDAGPSMEWSTPVGADWQTRRLELDHSGTTWYLTTTGTDGARLHSAKTGVHAGEPVVDITRVEQPSEGDVVCGHCGAGPMSLSGGKTHHGHKHPDKPRDLQPADADSDGEDTEVSWEAQSLDDDHDWDVSFPIPNGVTREAVRDAVDDRETLRGVVDELDWPPDDEHARDRVRALVFSINGYSSLNRPEGKP